MSLKANKFLLVLCYVQGIYFAVTGLWPIFHIDSFIVVTGPKTDLWLVRAVGVQVIAIAACLLTAAAARKIDAAVAVLGISSAAGFALIDIYYAYFRDRISNIYLADAAAQIVLVAAWAIAISSKKKDERNV